MKKLAWKKKPNFFKDILRHGAPTCLGYFVNFLWHVWDTGVFPWIHGFLFPPPTSQTVKDRFLYSTVSTLKPMVGIVVTTSPVTSPSVGVLNLPKFTQLRRNQYSKSTFWSTLLLNMVESDSCKGALTKIWRTLKKLKSTWYSLILCHPDGG